MKRAIKKKSNLYSFLDTSKVLESGSIADIEQARKIYWKNYKSLWRKNQRSNTKQYTLAYTQAEAKGLIDAAKRHRCSTTSFIKSSCNAYLHKRYLPTDPYAINAVHQQLSMNYNAIQKLFDENLLPYQVGVALMKQISDLEQQVLNQLCYPKTLEQWISETVKDKPEYKGTLIELLQKL